MFNLVKEGEKGWTKPSAKEKFRRRVRFALGLNPFFGQAPTSPEMSAAVFMKRQGTFDQLMIDTMEYLRRQKDDD